MACAEPTSSPSRVKRLPSSTLAHSVPQRVFQSWWRVAHIVMAAREVWAGNRRLVPSRSSALRIPISNEERESLGLSTKQ